MKLSAILAAGAFACVGLLASTAEAKPRRIAPAEVCNGPDIMRPCLTVASPNFLSGVREISVTMKREKVPRKHRAAEARAGDVQFGIFHAAINRGAEFTKPARYIAGRLICAINVNAALAERGIKGTGSAWAKSFLGWGRSSMPVPGAVAVSSRRGGGHVAIVSRVEGDQIYVWNPSPRGRGWQEVAYRHRPIDFRVPG